jgi:hypothetical protein
MGHLPINRRCGHECAAYAMAGVVVKLHFRLWFSPTHLANAPLRTYMPWDSRYLKPAERL